MIHIAGLWRSEGENLLRITWASCRLYVNPEAQEHSSGGWSAAALMHKDVCRNFQGPRQQSTIMQIKTHECMKQGSSLG